MENRKFNSLVDDKMFNEFINSSASSFSKELSEIVVTSAEIVRVPEIEELVIITPNEKVEIFEEESEPEIDEIEPELEVESEIDEVEIEPEVEVDVEIVQQKPKKKKKTIAEKAFSFIDSSSSSEPESETESHQKEHGNNLSKNLLYY